MPEAQLHSAILLSTPLQRIALDLSVSFDRAQLRMHSPGVKPRPPGAFDRHFIC